MNFEGTVFCKNFIKRWIMVFVCNLTLFYECDLSGCLIYDREMSKQLERKKIDMLWKHLEEVLFVQILKNMQF